MQEEVRLPRLVTVEHSFDVPLDHDDAAGPTVTVFAREVADPDGRDRPFLVYLQGGPGFEAPRPTRIPSNPGWLDRALAEFRVLMFDQRGTGRSTPVGFSPGSRQPSRPTTWLTSEPTRSSATPNGSGVSSASSAGACSGRASAGCV